MRELTILTLAFLAMGCENNISSTSTGGGAQPVIEIPETQNEKEENDNEQT